MDKSLVLSSLTYDEIDCFNFAYSYEKREVSYMVKRNHWPGFACLKEDRFFIQPKDEEEEYPGGLTESQLVRFIKEIVKIKEEIIKEELKKEYFQYDKIGGESMAYKPNEVEIERVKSLLEFMVDKPRFLITQDGVTLLSVTSNSEGTVEISYEYEGNEFTTENTAERIAILMPLITMFQPIHQWGAGKVASSIVANISLEINKAQEK